MTELEEGQAMWYMMDYESVYEEELYGIEMLKGDDRIFVFYNMGNRGSVENGELREAAKKGISFQNTVLHKRGKNALDFYTSSKIGEICGRGVYRDITVISEDKGSRALYEYQMYAADIRKRIILRNTTYCVFFDFEFDQFGHHDSCSDFKTIYLHCIKQYGREMGCEPYWHSKRYMEIRRNYVNVTSMQDQRKYYIVLGRYKPSIYGTVNDHEHNIIGYPNAFGRVFSSCAQAEEFFFDYLADSYLAASTASINELWNDLCYRVNQDLQYENETIMKGSLAGYACEGVHADTRRFHTFWIIASKDGIVMKMKNIIHENERMKKISTIEGELLAGKVVLVYTLEYECRGIKMYCSHIKMADWAERGVHMDRLPYRLYAVIGKAKEGLKVTVLHFQQENWSL